MYEMTPLYMDSTTRTVLMIIALIVQSIFTPIVLLYVIMIKKWVAIVLGTITGIKIAYIIDSYILVCSKTLSNKICHLTFQVLGSISAFIFFLVYAYFLFVIILLSKEIPYALIAVLLLDEICWVFCNINSYKIIQEMKEYNLIPQMNFPYYPSNIRFFNPAMEMRELPGQMNFMPKMLSPFMGNVQVPN